MRGIISRVRLAKKVKSAYCQTDRDCFIPREEETVKRYIVRIFTLNITENVLSSDILPVLLKLRDPLGTIYSSWCMMDRELNKPNLISSINSFGKGLLYAKQEV